MFFFSCSNTLQKEKNNLPNGRNHLEPAGQYYWKSVRGKCCPSSFSRLRATRNTRLTITYNPGQNSTSLSAILAPADFSAISDPISTLFSFFSSPEFALVERDITETGMREFDDGIRRWLDPTTISERRVTDTIGV